MSKRAPKYVWIESWIGNEELKLRIEEIAKRVIDTDLRVRTKYPSSVATGLICQSMNTGAPSIDPDVAAAAKAQDDLYNIQHKAVWEYGLEFDFVRKVWSKILDPING